MGTIRATSLVTGTLDDTSYSVGGVSTISATGCTVETMDISTTYVNAQPPVTGKVYRVLISNEGESEVKVRVKRETSPDRYQYQNIPAGRHVVVYSSSTEIFVTDILQVSVKSIGGDSRVVILQAWR